MDKDKPLYRQQYFEHYVVVSRSVKGYKRVLNAVYDELRRAIVSSLVDVLPKHKGELITMRFDEGERQVFPREPLTIYCSVIVQAHPNEEYIITDRDTVEYKIEEHRAASEGDEE